MREVRRTALLPYSARQLYDVVNDVLRYPEFLPWCVGAEILEQDETTMTARLDLARGGLQQSFVTRNDLVPGQEIRLALVEGPFSTLSGCWQFTRLGEDGCRIDMQLAFDINNRLMGATLGRVFNAAADRLVDAFCERADALYGGVHG